MAMSDILPDTNAYVEEPKRFMGSPRARLFPADDQTASHYAGAY